MLRLSNIFSLGTKLPNQVRRLNHLLIIQFMTLSVAGQDSTIIQASADSVRIARIREYIKPMSEYITLKLTQTTDAESITQITPTIRYDIVPNLSSTTRISLGYRFISFSFSFAPQFLPGNSDDDIQGKTKTGAFGFAFNLHHWQQELGFSKVKGYYIENTKDFDPGWEVGDPYLQVPDLQWLSFYGRTGYKFNDRFSVNAIVSQSERQLTSAGTFIPAISYRYYIIDNRDNRPGAQKSTNFETLLHVGYYHNFVLKQKFYIALGATPGFGYLFTSFYTKSDPETKYKQQNPVLSIDGRLGLGYNGERFAGGFYTTLTASNYKQENAPVTNGDARLHYQLFLAYRFTAPAFLKKWVEWGEKKGTDLLPKKDDT
jgi:hypothetical protein